MLEKLILAAALTLSVQIFAGASHSAKLPNNYVFRSLQNPIPALKRFPCCSTVACSGDRLLGHIFSAAEPPTYSH